MDKDSCLGASEITAPTHSTPVSERSSIKRKTIEEDLTTPTVKEPYKSRKIHDIQDELNTSETFLGFSDSDIYQDTSSVWPEHSSSSLEEDTSGTQSTIQFIEKSFRDIVKFKDKTELPHSPHPYRDMDKPTVREELLDVFKSKEFQTTLYDTLSTILDEKIKNVETKVDSCDIKLANIETRLNNIDQVCRSNKLIVSGIPLPDKNNNDLALKFVEIAGFLGIQMSIYDITEIYRIRKRNNDDKPPLVSVAFLNKRARNEVFYARGKLRNYNSAKLYINEDLTPSGAELFFKSRARARLLNLNGCFTRHGTVFIKKNKDSVPVKIDSTYKLDTEFPVPGDVAGPSNPL